MIPIIYKTRDELLKVDLDKLIYVEADSNYVHLHFRNGMSPVVMLSLQQIQDTIQKYGTPDVQGRFIRIGRRFIIDRRYVAQINIPKQHLILTDWDVIQPIRLSVSKEALKSLKQTLSENTER